MKFKVGQRYTFNGNIRYTEYTIIEIGDNSMGWSWIIDGEYGENKTYSVTKFNKLLKNGEVTLIEPLLPKKKINKFTL